MEIALKTYGYCINTSLTQKERKGVKKKSWNCSPLILFSITGRQGISVRLLRFCYYNNKVSEFHAVSDSWPYLPWRLILSDRGPVCLKHKLPLSYSGWLNSPQWRSYWVSPHCCDRSGFHDADENTPNIDRMPRGGPVSLLLVHSSFFSLFSQIPI